MHQVLEGACPHCDAEGSLVLRVDQADHDNNLIDLVVECSSCKRELNGFMSLDDMFVLTPGLGEVL